MSAFARWDSSDPGHPTTLGELSGVVDLRANVSVLPTRRTTTFAQLPFAPAAIRAFLAPLGSHRVAIGPVFTYGGARLLAADASLDRLWAPGTHRRNDCFYSRGDLTKPCALRMSFHVGGPHGFDTRQVADGHYQFCIEALSDSDVRSRRCTRVTIEN